jgi:SAM-dependent methyltransferase
LFRHGLMDDPEYAISSFEGHLQRCRALGFAAKNFVVLEVGPGDSLGSALVARAHGAERTWLVDVGPFASSELSIYDAIRARLAARGLIAAGTRPFATIDEYLQTCGAQYLTAGVASLRQVPTASVDLIWSGAVLEHVRLGEFDTMLTELRRVLKPGGFASHGVDLQDHLGGSLNNLRFSERTWESEFMASSGFYTNRIRYSDMLARFERAGFETASVEAHRWPRLPIGRKALAPPFAALTDEELRVYAFDIVSRPRAG